MARFGESKGNYFKYIIIEKVLLLNWCSSGSHCCVFTYLEFLCWYLYFLSFFSWLLTIIYFCISVVVFLLKNFQCSNGSLRFYSCLSVVRCYLVPKLSVHMFRVLDISNIIIIVR